SSCRREHFAPTAWKPWAWGGFEMTPQVISVSQLRYHWRVYLLALPAMLMIGLFIYYPAFSGMWHSLYRWNGADINEYVGLGNYAALFSDREFWQSFRVA